MKTTITWIESKNNLPPIDFNRQDEDGWVFSIPVLGVEDGMLFDSVCYIYEYYRGRGESPGVPCRWMLTGKWNHFADITHWASFDSFYLPGEKPKEKTYTLKQLRQAWGKGFHDGKMGWAN